MRADRLRLQLQQLLPPPLSPPPPVDSSPTARRQACPSLAQCASLPPADFTVPTLKGPLFVGGRERTWPLIVTAYSADDPFSRTM